MSGKPAAEAKEEKKAAASAAPEKTGKKSDGVEVFADDFEDDDDNK